MLAFGVLATVGLTPMLAHAQFQVNNLFGKTFPQVTKMLGTPLEKTNGTPITYSRFTTPGALDTIVWYQFATGLVGKVQVFVLAKPGESAADSAKVLKRYGLAIGADPHVFQLRPPEMSMASNGSVPGLPWMKVAVSYSMVPSFNKALVTYCHDHHLSPTKTYIWTLQVTSRKTGGRDRMAGAADDSGGAAKGGNKKGGSKKGKH